MAVATRSSAGGGVGAATVAALAGTWATMGGGEAAEAAEAGVGGVCAAAVKGTMAATSHK